MDTPWTISVASQSPRKSSVDGKKYWPRTSGRFGGNPHISWSGLPPQCNTVTIKIIDLGGEGEFAKEGAGFVHLHLEVPAKKVVAIPAGGADALAKQYGRPNSHGENGYFPLQPPHPPHYYAVEVTACGHKAQIVHPFPRPLP